MKRSRFSVYAAQIGRYLLLSLLLVVLLVALGAAYFRYTPPLVVSGVSSGRACAVCAPVLQGPWVRIELENRSWLPVVLQSVGIGGPDARSISTVQGVFSTPPQIALAPERGQAMFSYRDWTIPARSRGYRALHLASEAEPGGAVPRIAAVRIVYTWLGLPVTLIEAIGGPPE